MCSELRCSLGIIVAFHLPSCFVPEGMLNRWIRRPLGFWRYHCTLLTEAEKLHLSTWLAPSWRLRAGGLCSTSTPRTPDEERETVTDEGHCNSYKTLKVFPLPHPVPCFSADPIDDEDRKSAGLVSSSPSLNNTAAAQSFRCPSGAAPTHSKPGQTKAPAQCLLASSWCFLFLDISTVRHFSKPWGGECHKSLWKCSCSCSQSAHPTNPAHALTFWQKAPPSHLNQFRMDCRGVRRVRNKKVIILGL